VSDLSQVSKNQAAWLAIESDCDLLQQVEANGIARLSIADIKKHREPRLLTSLGEYSSLPPFLRDNGLSILPSSTRSFYVGRFQAFHDLPDLSNEVAQLVGRSDLATLRLRPNSEATGILAALDTGMFEDFLGETPARLGIMGRMGSGKFSFRVQGYAGDLQVESSQIEIDAGIETPSSVALVEAKATEPRSFLIRQLYYPFRTWTDKLKGEKGIRPIFLLINNDRFSLVEYRFEMANVYSSVQLVRHKTFMLSDSQVPEVQFEDALAMPPLAITKGVPFPQADSLDRIVSLLTSMYESEGEIYKEDVATQQVFHERQADYYLNAAKYLGLVEEPPGASQLFRLTPDGRSVVESDVESRSRHLAIRLLRDPVVREVFLAISVGGIDPTSNEATRSAMSAIQNRIDSGEIEGVEAASTVGRRAQTIVAWCRWLLDHIG
jgi:hypothetical protein